MHKKMHQGVEPKRPPNILNDNTKCVVSELTPTAFGDLSLFYSVLKSVLTVLVLSVPILLESLYRLFVSPPSKSIKNQVVVVTGAGHGIGRAIALRLAREECKIAVVDISMVTAQQTANDLHKMNAEAKAFHADVGNFEAVAKMLKDVESEFGPIDIMINNAGLLPKFSLCDGSVEEIDRMMTVNVSSHFYTVRCLLDGMIERKRGHIVAISSGAAYHAFPGMAVYSATKAAVAGFMASITEELRHKGYSDYVKLTTVYPYFVQTRDDVVVDKKVIRFPPVQPANVADAAIVAMLRNHMHVSVPNHNRVLSKFYNLLPQGIQSLFRDLVFDEGRICEAVKECLNM